MPKGGMPWQLITPLTSLVTAIHQCMPLCLMGGGPSLDMSLLSLGAVGGLGGPDGGAKRRGAAARAHPQVIKPALKN